jgi:hypothetical protein
MRALVRFADQLVAKVVPKTTAEACVCGDCYQSNLCGQDGCPMGMTPVYCTDCNCTRQWKVSCQLYWQCF